jgi:hypothetical protein
MHDGYFPLWRKIIEWGWYKDSNTKAVFIHLLLNANFKENYYLGHKILRGQCVTGLKAMSYQLGISIQSTRTAIKHLKSTGEITTKPTNRFSIVTLLNFERYIPPEKKSTSKSTSQLTHNQQTTNKQLTTPYNDNNDNNTPSGNETKIISSNLLVSIINRYITEKGWEMNNPALKSDIYNRCFKPAKQLILIAGGVNLALKAISKMASEYKKKNLDWTLETVIKHYADLSNNKPKTKETYG